MGRGRGAELYRTSVSAHWRVPYAVEENLRGMNEKITRRTTTSESNKFLQVIARFRKKYSDIK